MPRRARHLLVAGLAFGLAASVHAGLGPHDVTPISHNPGGPCAPCHNVSAAAATRGWGLPSDNAPVAGWFSQSITVLCYSCHQTGGGGVGASPQTERAMGNNHQFTIGNAPPKVNALLVRDTEAIAASNLPYTKGSHLQCTSCHNPHNADARPFLVRSTIRSLCNACHPGRDYATIGAQNTAGVYNVSVHPVNVPMDNSIGGAVSIKTVGLMDGALKVPIDNVWSLGGKLTQGSTGNVSCETCHAVHGTASGVSGVEDLLAIDNFSDNSSAPTSYLCTGCHFGGISGGNTGIAGLADHPMDNNAGRPFYPAGVALPDEWKAIGFGGTSRLDHGVAVFNTGGKPRCSSCHDSHGGFPGKAMLRTPLPGKANGEWCFSCHTANPQVTPESHHSVQGIEGGAFTSRLTCESCHNKGLGAHNGFFQTFVQDNVPFSFTTARGRSVSKDDVAVNRDSALCLYCHSDADPLRSRSDNTVLPMPSSHGTNRGGASHYLGPARGPYRNPSTGQALSIPVTLKATSWAVDNNAFSKYGGNTPGGGATAPGPITANSEVICESCHSVLYNDAAVHPGLSKYSNRTTSGWAFNLLLKPYEDDLPGIGSGTGTGYGVGTELCAGCHPFSGTTHHPLSPIDFTKADQTNAPLSGTAAPGALSLPRANEIDCDTCHRPHSANPYSDAGPDARYAQKVFLILELDNTGSRYHQLCGQCHSQY